MEGWKAQVLKSQQRGVLKKESKLEFDDNKSLDKLIFSKKNNSCLKLINKKYKKMVRSKTIIGKNHSLNKSRNKFT
jgi:hypothetical protein